MVEEIGDTEEGEKMNEVIECGGDRSQELPPASEGGATPGHGRGREESLELRQISPRSQHQRPVLSLREGYSTSG
ncbi:Hypothetical protein NTJ_08765 [Nesidiocoris tenuis]|uniref:CTNNB1 binding N-teminal domain-containing protein n=1 Tax=Nesidiocoris tenuis TaxID=355587 RepID=A0ABN7AYL4_9HEMI|nr:Hypothetical protein NTJ_08765 [Nesidiocoris tenuis]